MQEVLRETYNGEIHISTGMSTKEEIEQIVTFWEKGKGRAKESGLLLPVQVSWGFQEHISSPDLLDSSVIVFPMKVSSVLDGGFERSTERRPGSCSNVSLSLFDHMLVPSVHHVMT